MRLSGLFSTSFLIALASAAPAFPVPSIAADQAGPAKATKPLPWVSDFYALYDPGQEDVVVTEWMSLAETQKNFDTTKKTHFPIWQEARSGKDGKFESRFGWAPTKPAMRCRFYSYGSLSKNSLQGWNFSVAEEGFLPAVMQRYRNENDVAIYQVLWSSLRHPVPARETESP